MILILSLSKTIDNSIVLNIDKLISLVVDFNFNNYKLIHKDNYYKYF